MTWIAARRVCLVLGVALLACMASDAHAADTFVLFKSEPGDPIGRGGNIRLTPENGVFAGSGSLSNGVALTFQGATSISFFFTPPNGQSLTPGTFENASRFGGVERPGLDVSGSGRSCNVVTGRFVVLEIAFAPDGSLARFAAEFEQHCEGLPFALFGVVRIDSDVPVLDSDGDGVFDIDDNCATVPNPDQADVDRDRLGNVCDPIQGLTLIFLDSQPGDFIGGGQQFTFGSQDQILISGNFDGGVTVTGGDFRLEFAPPVASPFTVGKFEGATRFPFNTGLEPGLDISGRSRGCNRSTGRFEVLEIAFDSAGQPIRFAADFEQRCESPLSPALFGVVRFNSELTDGGVFDVDGDRVINIADNCPMAPNSNQANRDSDAFGDVCDPFPDAPDNLGVCLVESQGLSETVTRQAMTIVDQQQTLSAGQVAIGALQTERDQLRADNDRLRREAADADGDGVPDGTDRCPDSAASAAVNRVGCSRAQVCGAIRLDSPFASIQCVVGRFADDPALQSCRVQAGASASAFVCVAR